MQNEKVFLYDPYQLVDSEDIRVINKKFSKDKVKETENIANDLIASFKQVLNELGIKSLLIATLASDKKFKDKIMNELSKEQSEELSEIVQTILDECAKRAKDIPANKIYELFCKE